MNTSTQNLPYDDSWYLDSRATNHLTSDVNNLQQRIEYSGPEKIHMGNGSGIGISNIGTSYIQSLKNLLHAPLITKNLLSISQFARENKVFFEFHPDTCLVKS
uniref:Retrovirus-related Pol polyprotein from transposon TNT 1-94-like beta-barrel domain-containing protein n=1 Tax=Cajanus cajan TaxID=3821 RepID=A0A151TYX5_CAJCA|nr:hypothetical protein KK1_004838 [Cajanus cajan]